MERWHAGTWTLVALVALVGLSLAACGKGAAGVDHDAGADAPAPQEDASARADSGGDAAPQADAGDDAAPPLDGPRPDGAQSDAAPQTDAGITGCLPGTFTPYWGNIHAHTSYSDGTGSPAEAFDHARFTAGLDIQILTDHLEQIPIKGGWAPYLAAADDKYVAGTFVAAAGFEYGSGFTLVPPSSTGHNNVFFSPDLFPTVQLDFHDFYDTLYACTSCIGQFNHPGDGQDVNWDDFDYYADVDQRMNLFEFNSDPAWDLFFDALGKGWTISPVWNQDNHSANWGTANDNRTGFWMSSLDRVAMYDAMLKRRTFATQDKKAWIKVMAAGDCWMGSLLKGISSVPITVEVNDTDNDHGFNSIEIFGPSKNPLGTHDCGGAMTCSASFNVTVPVPPGATFVVARATLTTGRVIVAAPVWASLQ